MRTAPTALCLLLLAACAQEREPAPARERDPASEQALADQILIDPDLAHQNEGNAALTVASDHSLPLLVATPEAIAAARAEAAVLAGGSDQLLPPLKPGTLARSEQGEWITPAEVAARLPGESRCTSGLTYSAAWAARMPPAIPVYPGGATLEAAGSDADGCALRVVTFVTAVPTGEVLSFYAARARMARFAATHAANETHHVLWGGKGAAAFRLSLHESERGLTEVTLATIGG